MEIAGYLLGWSVESTSTTEHNKHAMLAFAHNTRKSCVVLLIPYGEVIYAPLETDLQVMVLGDQREN